MDTMAISNNRKQQRKILRGYYAVFDDWLIEHDVCCSKGCASCCTQSVNVTTLEAEIITEFLLNNSMHTELNQIKELDVPLHEPLYSTNEFARLCLEQTNLHIDEEGWNFQRCPFLKNESCSIYVARPFGCRSFVSTIPCHEQGAAVISPKVITTATVINQFIEHLDQGRPWGNMLHVLKKLITSVNMTNEVDSRQGKKLLVSQKIPGFLIPPDEEKEVKELLIKLVPGQIERHELGLIF